MAIKINHVGVKNLGPLLVFDKDFKLINLIYSRNEQGKTFLVEFIYQSLFKNVSNNIRSNNALGQISVSGLDKELVSFAPSIKKKLEDFWVDSIPGLPKDFSKLLVVKGADLDLTSSNSAGIDYAILKEFLSGEGLLEKIEKRLGKTETSATIADGKITGARRGELQKYYDGRDRIEKIDLLFQEINQNISGGSRYQLKQEIEILSTKIQEQENAKRYLAYTIDAQNYDLKAKREEAPDSILTELDQMIAHYKQNNKELEKKVQELVINKEYSKHYPWVNNALEEYQKLLLLISSIKPKTGKFWLIVALLAAILSILFILFNQPYVGIIAILISIVSGVIYQIGQRKILSNAVLNPEITKIDLEYKERFGTNLSSGITTLKTKQNELQPVYFSLDQLNKDIEHLKLDQENLEYDISKLFSQLIKPVPEILEWEKTIEILIENNKTLDKQIRENDINLAALGIEPGNYMANPVSVDYDRDQLANAKRSLEASRETLKNAEDELQRLKQVVCGITNDDISIPWDELIEKL